MSENVNHGIWSKNFTMVCFSSFFMFLNFYMLATTMPLYVKESLKGNHQQMSLVIAFYVLGNVALRPFSGMWVDRFGKKKLAIISLSLYFLCSFAYLAINSVIPLLVIRVFHGMGYAIGSTATTAIAISLIPESKKGEGIGYFGMFMSIAMVIGPTIGLLVSANYQYSYLLMICTVVAFLSLFFTVITKDSKVLDKSKSDIHKKERGIEKFIELKALPVSIAGFIIAFSYSSLISFVLDYTKEIHQPSAAVYFFTIFALMIIIPRPVIGKVFDKYGENFLAYPGILLFAFGMIVLSQANTNFIILCSAVLMGIGYGGLFPCLQALSIKLAPNHRSGVATGTFFLLFDMGYGLGVYILSLIATATNYRTMFFVAAMIVLLAAVIYYFFHHRVKKLTVVRT